MMSQKTPTVTGKQLSSSLKERLKKCGRYHASPKVLTPVADQVESSHTSPAAKRLCSSEHNETTNPADDGSCVASFTTPDSKLKSRNDNIAHCDNFFKVVEPPSELQQNISASSGGRRTSKMETDRNRNSVGHKMAGEKSVTSWTVGSSLNSRSTPVSSRSQTRTNMKVNKLDFEKETERTKCVLATQIKFQTKSLDVATKVEETFEATNSAVKQINKGENNRSQSLIEDSCSLNKKDSDAESNYTEKQRLLKEIDEKEETLRKLKMVKMYRTKNNLAELEELIEKWRAVSQQGLQDLHEALPEPKPNFSELLQHLGVDYNLVKFDPTEETFNL